MKHYEQVGARFGGAVDCAGRRFNGPSEFNVVLSARLVVFPRRAICCGRNIDLTQKAALRIIAVARARSSPIGRPENNTATTCALFCWIHLSRTVDPADPRNGLE